ncbi:Oligosaccharide translocation protein rft1 [Bachmanniomyces sp. S44760]|nr:Oligosaccharide translocation protein rft1 [Bachmanniomyces sp. S44760]
MLQADKPSKIPQDDHDVSKTQSLLARSARGATFLISLQVGSRALTFIVNQVLLRYLSPELLGIATQLDLYTISVLYFARDSLRVALQRQKSGPAEATSNDDQGKRKAVASSHAVSHRAQEAVNISYIAIMLGPILVYVLADFYLRRAGAAVLASPYLETSLGMYAVAAMLELLIEPCFVIASSQMLYGIRASAETIATSARCILTCFAAIYASRSGKDMGTLPFAIGQVSYALALNIVYYCKVWPISVESGFSLTPKPMKSKYGFPHSSFHELVLNSGSASQYIASYFSRPILELALNLYAQSGLKHLLTQGDSVLIALFTSLTAQGVYALASNYGGLIARILFQPIEESSRGVFGRLLSSATSSQSVPSSILEVPSKDEPSKPSPSEFLTSARDYLRTILHLYSLLSVYVVCVGPTLAPLLLRYIAGPRWTSTSAGSVLAAYCYYIPLLAINGILEAFVSAAAKPAQLRTQSMMMIGFSAGFVGAGYIVLGVYDLGAKGLVLANAINMAMRICWSSTFVREYLREGGADLKLQKILPNKGTLLSGIASALFLNAIGKKFDGHAADFLMTVGIAGVLGILL